MMPSSETASETASETKSKLLTISPISAEGEPLAPSDRSETAKPPKSFLRRFRFTVSLLVKK